MNKFEDNMQEAVEAARRKTRSYARNMWQLIREHSSIKLLVSSSSDSTFKDSVTPTYHLWLYLLFSVPYLLILLFAFSFYWDFNGIRFEIYQFQFNLEGLLRILSVSGLIGFFTNWLAITMLFRPAQKRPILGQGLIPAQKNKIAYQLAKTVSEDLINPDIIKQKISESGLISIYRRKATLFIRGIIDTPEFRRELKRMMVQYVDEIMGDPVIRTAIAEKILEEIEDTLRSKTFERIALKAYTFMRGEEAQLIIEEALAQLPETVEDGLDQLDILLDRLPAKLDEHSDQIEDTVTIVLHRLINQLDVHSLVENNIREFEEEQLESMFKGATNEQLQYIQYLGAILGTIGGFLIWEPLLSLLGLTLLTVGILALDLLLINLRSV